MAFSISLQKREGKSRIFSSGLDPTSGEAIEIRVDTSFFQGGTLEFYAELTRLIERMRELGEPRGEFVVGPAPDSILLEDGQELLTEASAPITVES